MALSRSQTSDYLGYDAIIDADLASPKVLLADKAYDSDANRDDVEASRGTTVIPARKNDKSQEPVVSHICALQDLVERCFSKLKNARHRVTRQDKN